MTDNQAAVERVLLETPVGRMIFSVEVNRAPATSAYFLADVRSGRFNGTTIHRIATEANQDPDQRIPIEVVQGGCSQPNIAPQPSLVHESTVVTGLRHSRGAISLARFAPGCVYHSFFICMRDEPSLDYGGLRQPDGLGFAAFGQAVEGVEVLDKLYARAEEREQLTRQIPILELRVA
jgi:peptidyl-prolyl cis-trans isomerase A (cyclophilin A)